MTVAKVVKKEGSEMAMSSVMMKLKFRALIACSAAGIAVARDLIWVDFR